MKNVKKVLAELKKEKQDRFNKHLTDCKVFFAFSNEQFAQNKVPLEEGDKYVSMGMGGYIPKSQVDKYIKGSKEIDKWFKAEVKKTKGAREANILYELSNHEAFYTGDIEDTVDALGEGYTYEEVREVYLKYREEYA